MSHREYLKHIGMELRIARIRKGYTQSYVASKTGFEENVISYVELGKRDAAILTYKRIADALGIEMKDIL